MAEMSHLTLSIKSNSENVYQKLLDINMFKGRR